MRPHAATGIAAVVGGHCVGARRGQHPPWLPAHGAQKMRHRIPMLIREPPTGVLNVEQPLQRSRDRR